jgi:hypothetical protein
LPETEDFDGYESDRRQAMIARIVLFIHTVLLLASTEVDFQIPNASAGEAGTKRLVTTIDCTKDDGPEAYFGFGDVRGAQSAAGKYTRSIPVAVVRPRV